MATNERPEKVERGLPHQTDRGKDSMEPPGARDGDADFSDAFLREYVKKVDAICKKYHVSAYDKFGIVCEIAAAVFISEATDADYTQFSEQVPKLGNPMVYFAAKGALGHLKERGVNRANVREYMENRIKEFEESARKDTNTPDFRPT